MQIKITTVYGFNLDKETIPEEEYSKMMDVLSQYNFKKVDDHNGIIELTNLEDLLNLNKKIEYAIIVKNDDDNNSILEIYNNYRE